MELKRLTTDNPEKNIETLLNYAYAEDGWVKLRSTGGEEGVDLCDYIEQQRRELGFDCGVFSTDVRDGACMECDCVLAILNIVAIQAAELRGKLKYYEDMEEQGRLLVLPCKVGDTLYRICRFKRGKNWTKEAEFIRAVQLNQNTLWRIVFGGEFGKTVFLTREEAEKALKGGAE